MEKCHKCGAELRKDQKVCIVCGTPTPAGGNFYVEEDKKWTPTTNQKFAFCVAGLLIIAFIIALAMRVTPPNIIAQHWVDAISSREIIVSRKYSTPHLEEDLQSRLMSLTSVADDYNSRVMADQATYKVGMPTYMGKSKADVIITFTNPDNSVYEVHLDMIKQGRHWRVNKIM